MNADADEVIREEPRRIARRVALFAAVGAVVVLALLTLPGVEEVRDRVVNGDHLWIAVTAACSLGSMLGFVAALAGAFDRVMPWRAAVVLGFAEQGTNVLLPAGGAGGPAFGTLVMRRAGVPGPIAAARHAALFFATSAVSFAALVVFGTLVGLGVLPGDGVSPVGAWLPAAGAALVLGLAYLFARMGAPVPRPPDHRVLRLLWRARRFVHGGVRDALVLIRRGDPFLVLGAVAYYALDVGALGAAFQAAGGGAPPLGVFVLAYTLGHAGALAPTPGGVGGTDGGLIGMFVVYDADLGLAAAAVLAYRVFQLGLPVILGGLSLLRIRQRLRGAPLPEEVAARYEALRR